MGVVSRNSRGFTLIEALIAILILSIMLLGLIPAFMKAYNVNQEVSLRDAAIDIAHERLEVLRTKGLSNLVSNSTCVVRRIMKRDVPYTVDTLVASLYGGDVYQVTVKVRWKYRDDNVSYNVTTVVGDMDG